MNPLSCLLLATLAVDDVARKPDGTVSELPETRASSKVVDVKIDDGPFVKGAWRAAPEFKPDLFIIGSTLPYRKKTVTFRTDVDSISFDVCAGNDYDFVILLNGDDRCHTRIWARPDPAIWELKFIVPICVGLFATIAFTVIRWKQLPLRPLRHRSTCDSFG